MELAVGAILDGTVKSITNFGAFVNLPEGKSGLVHISEVSSSYVNNVRDHLSEGQNVKVKVMNIDPNGKISLSIRRAQEQDTPRAKKPAPHKPQGFHPAPVKQPLTFEDKLKQFLSDADSNLASNRLYADRRSKTRRR